MTITLPDEMRATLELKAAAAGFASVDEYVADVLADGPDIIETGPPHFRTREEFDKLIEEGLASGVSGVMDDAFWDERRRVLAAKVNGRAGATP